MAPPALARSAACPRAGHVGRACHARPQPPPRCAELTLPPAAIAELAGSPASAIVTSHAVREQERRPSTGSALSGRLSRDARRSSRALAPRQPLVLTRPI